VNHFSGVVVSPELIAAGLLALAVAAPLVQDLWTRIKVDPDQLGFYAEDSCAARRAILCDRNIEMRQVTTTPLILLRACAKRFYHFLDATNINQLDIVMDKIAALCLKYSRVLSRTTMEYDCFLSHRWGGDDILVNHIHDKLKVRYPSMKIFCDQYVMEGSLKRTFLKAIAKTRLFIPILSLGSMERHRNSVLGDAIVTNDNMLLEIQTALALQDTYNAHLDDVAGLGNVNFVIPIVISDWRGFPEFPEVT